MCFPHSLFKPLAFMMGDIHYQSGRNIMFFDRIAILRGRIGDALGTDWRRSGIPLGTYWGCIETYWGHIGYTL